MDSATGEPEATATSYKESCFGNEAAKICQVVKPFSHSVLSDFLPTPLKCWNVDFSILSNSKQRLPLGQEVGKNGPTEVYHRGSGRPTPPLLTRSPATTRTGMLANNFCIGAKSIARRPADVNETFARVKVGMGRMPDNCPPLCPREIRKPRKAAQNLGGPHTGVRGAKRREEPVWAWQSRPKRHAAYSSRLTAKKQSGISDKNHAKNDILVR